MEAFTETSADPLDILRPGREEEIADEMLRRVMLRKAAESEARFQAATLEACKASPVRFFDDWLWTFDPRMLTLGLPTTIPFKLRPKQAEFLGWLLVREATATSGLVEKSRDEGASFLMLGYLLWRWLFYPGYIGAIGSRKADLVDKTEDQKTLFAKLRLMLYDLPDWFLPKGFVRSKHDNYMRLVNPETGASLTGEGGDNMGRGGRSSLYFIDEWAHVQRAQMVNAAVSQNSNVRIKVFTPNGVGNVAYQERFSGRFPVFTFHWRDNPDKNWTREEIGENGEIVTVYPWYEKQKRELDEIEIAQEIDIDYAASVEGVVIPARWVQSAINLSLEAGDVKRSGLDVSADGSDKTIYAYREGGLVVHIKEVRGTPGEKPFKVIELCIEDGTDKLVYDKLGVGSMITATVKHKEASLPFKVDGVANSDAATKRKFDDRPEVRNDQRFANWAAEQWWALRLRFQKTHLRVTEGKPYPDEDCISIPNDSTLIAQLSQPIYTRNNSEKIVVDKLGHGTDSPDRAEAVLYSFAEGRGRMRATLTDL